MAEWSELFTEDDATNEQKTNCPICFEIFQTPKYLPCHHTFCLKCIQEHGKGKKPGDKMTCPLCRQEFPIPLNGFIGLYTNSDAEYIVQMRANTLEKSAHALKHNCQQHPDKPMELYCNTCNQMICMMCGLISHAGHSFKQLETSRLKFTSKLCEDKKQLEQCISDTQKQQHQDLLDIKAEQEKFVEVRKLILAEYNQLESIINAQKLKLLTQLDTLKENRDILTQKRRKDFESRLEKLNDMKSQYYVLLQNETTNKVSQKFRLNDPLNESNVQGGQSEDLLSFNLSPLPPLDVTFVSANVTDRVDCLLGELSFNVKVDKGSASGLNEGDPWRHCLRTMNPQVQSHDDEPESGNFYGADATALFPKLASISGDIGQMVSAMKSSWKL